MSDRELPSIDRLRQCLSYDPDTGVLRWRWRADASKAWNTRWAGREAGAAKDNGYISVSLDKTFMRAHRVAWALYYGVWPEDEIDHVDHARANNRIANLRDVTRTENRRNHSLSKANTSGTTGVTWCRKGKVWVAQLHVGRRLAFSQRFAHKADAIAARQRASQDYGFHDNHGVKPPKATEVAEPPRKRVANPYAA